MINSANVNIVLRSNFITERTKMNKREKYTNKLQMEAMVDIMKKNEDIACGFTQRASAEVKKFWEDLARTLNASGPPLKDAGGWRKVWSDYKSGVKKKLTKNKQLLAGTGGGPYKEIPLTETEEDVSVLVTLNTTVHGITKINNFGASRTPLPKIVEGSNLSEINLPLEQYTLTQEMDLSIEERWKL
ncbi:uncharacterized protein LOC135951251 [Calliphora vicina]|uniref:uncharacterized protein LOC135951251 n=1 Tax=Calliphora vicina TaxID=7373 RepID=UPI00325BA7E3